jgi:integrase
VNRGAVQIAGTPKEKPAPAKEAQKKYPRQVARDLAVTLSRAKVICSMIDRLRVASPIQLMNDIIHKWKTKKGTPLAPTSCLTLVTAAKVAATYTQREVDKWEYKRIERTIKKRLATHIRRQARPMSKQELRRLRDSPDISPLVKAAIVFSWVLALRCGDLKHIKGKDVTVFKSNIPCGQPAVIRIRARGLKGSEHGKPAHFRWIPREGLARSIWAMLKNARATPTRPIFDVSTARMVKALKTVAQDLSGHSVRRGAATHLANIGTPMSSIQKLLGHSHIWVTRMYVEPAPRQPEARKLTALTSKLL